MSPFSFKKVYPLSYTIVQLKTKVRKLSTAPIGIFDSGMGGLTVAKAISEALPNENFIYFGDTMHTPWGDKSKQTIEYYSIKICDFLLQYDCKVIVVACNTASSVAYTQLQKHLQDKVHIINVIDPVIDLICEKFADKNIGLIGTKQTILSKSYNNKIKANNVNINLQSLATPLLVPLIEEGFLNSTALDLILKEYLLHPVLKNIDALILGCTHYPLIRTQIQEFYENKITIIDSAKLTALYLQNFLKEKKMQSKENNTNKIFYISDYNPHFIETANLFFPNLNWQSIDVF